MGNRSRLFCIVSIHVLCFVCADLGCFFPAGIQVMSFTGTGLPMQSSGAPVSETNAVYCTTLMTSGSTVHSGNKPLGVTCSQRHVEAHPTSHLVTNRSYTESKLTSDYISERPSELLTGTIPDAQSKSKSYASSAITHNVRIQRNNVPNLEGNKGEYVQFIRSSSASPPAAAESEMGLVRSNRSQTSNHTMLPSKNFDDALYCEIRGNVDDEHSYDEVFPTTGYSTATGREDVIVERDKLLQRVSHLTAEKQAIVYKLCSFVETNAQLHAEVERSHAAITQLRNKLHEVELTLEHEQHENALIKSRLVELTSLWTSSGNEHYVNQDQLSANNIWQATTLEGAVYKTGDCICVQ